MTNIGEKPFTITQIEDSDYTQGDKTTKGVKITTKESFDVEGHEEKQSKFHTTRVAIVNVLSNEKIREDVNQNNNPLGPVKCVKGKTKAGNPVITLEDAD